MFLIGIKDGKNPAGNAGTVSLQNIGGKRLSKLAKNFSLMYKHDEVYFVPIFTQEMCEMEPGIFVEYVRKNFRKVA